jgi:hypothetical protein
MNYVLTSEDLKQAEEFANKIDVNHYSGRNQFDDQKKRFDQKVGKLGELATYSYLKDKVNNLSYPDFEIYDSSNKNWNHDLTGENVNIHVKSQNIIQSIEFSTSFIFEKSDSHIFKNYSDKDYVSFVVINLINKTADIKGIVKLTELHRLDLFKAPKLSKLGSKLAVYYDDLVSSSLESLFAI